MFNTGKSLLFYFLWLPPQSPQQDLEFCWLGNNLGHVWNLRYPVKEIWKFSSASREREGHLFAAECTIEAILLIRKISKLLEVKLVGSAIAACLHFYTYCAKENTVISQNAADLKFSWFCIVLWLHAHCLKKNGVRFVNLFMAFSPC